MNELEKNYLAHHGILGQRWHKRNGPPYPLDAGDHSKSEKEAGYKKSLGGGRNEEMYDRKGRISARKAKRLLNKHDQGRAEDSYKSEQNQKKAEGYKYKSEKLVKKQEERAAKSFDKDMKKIEKYGRDDPRSKKILAERAEDANKTADKLSKLSEKQAKYEAAAKQYKDYADEHAKVAQKMLDEISKTGEFNVSSKETQRLVNKGQAMATSLMIDLTVSPLLGAAYLGSHMEFRKGTEYKVKEKSSKQKRQEYEEEVRRRKNSDREAVKKVVDKDKSTIARQAAQQMAKDAVRWAKEGSEQHSSTKGKSQDQIAKMFEKKIMDKIMNENTGYAETDTDGNIYFQIDGIPEFGGGQPQDVWYNPKTKKITGMGWT